MEMLRSVRTHRPHAASNLPGLGSNWLSLRLEPVRPSTHASGGAHLVKGATKANPLTVTALRPAGDPCCRTAPVSTRGGDSSYPVSGEPKDPGGIVVKTSAANP